MTAKTRSKEVYRAGVIVSHYAMPTPDHVIVVMTIDTTSDKNSDGLLPFQANSSLQIVVSEEAALKSFPVGGRGEIYFDIVQVESEVPEAEQETEPEAVGYNADGTGILKSDVDDDKK